MDYQTFNQNTDINKELALRQEHLIELTKLFVLLGDIDKITFLKYDFKYNNYQYSYTVDSHDVIDGEIDLINSKFTIVLKDGDVIFGKLVMSKRVKYRKVLRDLLIKIRTTLRKVFEIEKDILSQNTPLNIYLVADQQSITFAKKLQTNLDILLNADIEIINNLHSVSDKLVTKNSKNIIIYTVQDVELIQEDQNILNEYNEFVIVIGPNDHNLSLICGNLNIQNYLSYEKFSPEEVKNMILQTKYKLINKNKFDNKIIALSGVCGGSGTTTISMNVADIIARHRHEKNVLYIDLSTTKAISNLFLSQNPIPEHNIIDLVNLDDFNLEKNLELGLVKIRENFFAINGIQRHIDRDIVEQDIFIEKLLDYILKSSEFFNYIIIDTGVADSSALKSTIFDLVNEIWILTELTIPHVSTMKTLYSLLKRAGLKDKVSFIVNRVNSLNEISMNDFDSIMSTSVNEERLIYEKIPNDYETLGKCWNYCELASQVSPDSVFVNQLESILTKKEYINVESMTAIKSEKKDLFDLLKKGFKR